MAESDPRPFAVLFVCRANHCRSPLAEFLLRNEVEQRGLGWSVSSAGTHARAGQPMHPSVARLLTGRGLDTADWTSRAMDLASIEGADLVLTAAEEQRAAIARLAPTAMTRTFTLLQFAHLTTFVSTRSAVSAPDFGPRLLDDVSAVRGTVQPMPEDERDVADPMGQSARSFRRCAAVIERAWQQILSCAPVAQSPLRESVAG